NRITLIDDNHISNEILMHMPRLDTFKFYISIKIHRNNLIDYLSKDNIRKSFSNIKYQQVDCIVNDANDIITYQIFSLPFMFDCLKSIGNIFSSIIFNHVRRLTVYNDVPFRHEFFHRIA
ncbi:unnamed protein product, partial [Rotaria sordida]